MLHTKIYGGKRIHIIMDPETVKDLDWLAGIWYQHNRSKAIRDLIASATAAELKKGKKQGVHRRSRTR